MRHALTRRLYSADILTIGFAAFLALLALASSSRLPNWPHVVTTCTMVIIGVPILAWLRAHTSVRVLEFLHDWSLAPLVYVMYRELSFVVGPLHLGRVYDLRLIAADRWLFGTDPTIWLARLAHPAVTEVLQLAYTAFYLLFLLVGAEFYVRRDERDYRMWVFMCGFGFYLSYLGYLVVPAIGPRLTLHTLSSTARELPGLWLTPYLRAFVNAGGMNPLGVSDDVARALANRDVFPSGHTMMTLVAIYTSWAFRLRVRWIVSVVGGLLVIATVYLRYHYVVDVMAGAVLAVFAVAVGPLCYRWVVIRLGTLDPP